MGQARRRSSELESLRLRQKQAKAVKKRQEARWQAGELVKQHGANPSAAALGKSLQQLLGKGNATPADVEAVARVVDLAARRAQETIEDLGRQGEEAAGGREGQRAAEERRTGQRLGQDGVVDQAARTVQAAADRAVAMLDMQSLEGLFSQVMGPVGPQGSRPTAPAPGEREEHKERNPEAKKTAGLPLQETLEADAQLREGDQLTGRQKTEETFDRDEASRDVSHRSSPEGREQGGRGGRGQPDIGQQLAEQALGGAAAAGKQALGGMLAGKATPEQALEQAAGGALAAGKQALGGAMQAVGQQAVRATADMPVIGQAVAALEPQAMRAGLEALDQALPGTARGSEARDEQARTAERQKEQEGGPGADGGAEQGRSEAGPEQAGPERGGKAGRGGRTARGGAERAERGPARGRGGRGAQAPASPEAQLVTALAGAAADVLAAKAREAGVPGALVAPAMAAVKADILNQLGGAGGGASAAPAGAPGTPTAPATQTRTSPAATQATARAQDVAGTAAIQAKVAATKKALPKPKKAAPVAIPLPPKVESQVPEPAPGKPTVQPNVTISARTQSSPLPQLAAESVSPQTVAAAQGIDMAPQRDLRGAAAADPAVAQARAETQRQAGGIEGQAERAASAAPLREGVGAQAARAVAPGGAMADPARVGADAARRAAQQQSTGQMAGARVAAVPTSERLDPVQAAGGGPATQAAPATSDGATVAAVPAQLQSTPDGVVAPTLARSQAAMGGSAPAQTATQATAAPEVRPVTRPGGENVPSAGSIAQTRVSLSQDRSSASSGIAAEAQTRSRLQSEAAQQQQSELGPLDGEARAQFAAEIAARAPVMADGRARGTATHQTAQTGVATQQAGFQTHAQATAAQTAAEQAAEQARAQPTAATTATPAAQAAATAIASQAAAAIVAQAQAQPFVAPPGALALEAAGPQLAAQAQARMPDLTRAAALGVRPELPPTPGEGLSLEALAGPDLAAAKNITQDLQLPQITLPKPPPGGGGPGGAPSRQQGVSNIEASIAERMQSEGVPAIHQQAGALQRQLGDHANRAEQAAGQHLDAVLGQAAQTRAGLASEPLPVTPDQARALAENRFGQGRTEAEQATGEMTGGVTQARNLAESQHAAAAAAHQQAIQQAGARFDTNMQGQWLPEYQNQHGQALSAYDAEHQAAVTRLGADQQAADAAARARMTSEEAATQSRMQQERGALDQGTQRADTSFEQQSQAAQARHDANVQQIRGQTDAQVTDLHAQADQEVSRLQSEGQRDVDQQLTEGERTYQEEMDRGVQEADRQKAQAEQEAAEKRAEAERQKNDKSWLERAVDAVVSAVKSLLDAAMNILKKARDAVIGIMERARQAALGALQRFRQLALDALRRVKDAIQGAITAVAGAVRAAISAAANAIRTAVQGIADFLKSAVQELTNIVNGLIEAFQTAVNGLLDGLITAVGFINEDWARALDDATSGYRDAFNQAVDKAQETIQSASDALQSAIQQGADIAKSAVDTAEQALEGAVDTIENGLHSAVESAYTVAVDKVNQAFDRAEAAVNAVFDVAEAAVKAYFDAQIATLQIVSKGVELAGQAVNAVIHTAVQAICKVVDALVELIPDSVKEWFIDFWNGPWRDIIVIGLITVAAVAITVATMGTGAPIAAMLVAGAIGATMGGAAYFGGELAARNAEQDLERDHDAVYVPNFGYVKPDPATGQLIDPKTGQPIPQDQLAKMDGAQLQWAMSNFTQGPNGELVAKSGAELFDYASLEGLEGAIQGGVGAALAMSGGAAGVATAGIKNTIVKTLATKGLQAAGGFVVGLGKDGSLAFVQGIEAGKSPSEAFQDAMAKTGEAFSPEKLTETLITTALGMGLGTAQSHYLDGLLKSQVAQSLLNIGAGVGVDVLKGVVGKGGAAYLLAIGHGKSQEEALELAMAEAGKALTPQEIVKSILENLAQEVASPSKTQGAKQQEEAAAAAKAQADAEAAAKAQADAEAAAKGPQDPEATAKGPQDADAGPEPVAAPKSVSQDDAFAQLKSMSYDELVALPQIGTAKAQAIIDGIANGTIKSWADVDATPYFGPKTMSALEESLGVGAPKAPDTTLHDSFKANFGDERYASYEAEVTKAIELHPELAGVPIAELIAIRGYTSEDYWKLNQALRSGDPAAQAKYDTYVVAAAAGLAKMPAFQGTVFRGSKLPPDILANYQVGKTVTEHAFTSTAAAPTAAFDGNAKFVIQSKTGVDVAKLSVYAHEQEVLFRPGTQFKVLDVKFDAATGMTTIYMAEQ